MNKHQLLKDIGFSEKYIAHLRRVEEGGGDIVENPVVEYKRNSIDMTNITITDAITSFSTKFVSVDKTAE